MMPAATSDPSTSGWDEISSHINLPGKMISDMNSKALPEMHSRSVIARSGSMSSMPRTASTISLPQQNAAASPQTRPGGLPPLPQAQCQAPYALLLLDAGSLWQEYSRQRGKVPRVPMHRSVLPRECRDNRKVVRVVRQEAPQHIEKPRNGERSCGRHAERRGSRSRGAKTQLRSYH